MLKDAPSYSSYQPPTDEEPIYVKMQRWEKMLDKDMPIIKQKFYETIGKSDLVKELWQSNDLDEYSRIRSNRRLRNKNPNFTKEKIQALINDSGDKGIYFTLGGKTSHNDKISFQANATEMTLPSPEFQFNANYLFEIFTENKGAQGTGYFDENGILKLEFIDESSIKALYYLPPKN